jgi:glycosyltransferase 2 family protein
MFKNRFAVIAIGLLVSAVFVVLAVRGLDGNAVKHAFAEADLLPWLPLGIASYLASHLVRGVRCRLLVRRTAAIDLATATNVVVVGYAANNVLPARLGELVRAGMLAERTAMPLAQSLAVTFIERVLDGIVMLLLLVVATMTVHVAGWMQDLVYVALAVFGIATIAMFAGALAPRFVIAVAGRLGGVLGPRWRDRAVKLATSVTSAGEVLRDPKDASLLLLYSIVVWCLEAGLYIALLPVFGIPMIAQYGVITMCVTGFGLLLPSSPGFIGPFHYFASQAMMVHGVAGATAIAYATLVHLAFYVPVTLWGAGVMLWYGVKLGATATAVRDAQVPAGAPAEAVALAPGHGGTRHDGAKSPGSGVEPRV